MLSNHLILCHLLLLLPSIFHSFRVFSNESALCIRWPKYCNFSFSISPSDEYSGLISFRISCPRDSQESSSTTIWKNQLFGPQSSLWSSYHIHTGKTIALTRWTFVCKVMSLLFNMLSWFVIALFLRNKSLLRLQSLSSMILELKKINLSLLPLFSHLFAMKWWECLPWLRFFECCVSSQLFHFLLSPSSTGFLVPLHFLP